ncbi:MAG: hypothetical protein HZC02_04175 [Candidatus Levybacteria bacterium]|nr:hypothetical protein [Candidatus Levybacteria bacterium]
MSNVLRKMLRDKIFMSLALIPLILLMCIYIAVHFFGNSELAEQIRFVGVLTIAAVGFIFLAGERITSKIKNFSRS